MPHSIEPNPIEAADMPFEAAVQAIWSWLAENDLGQNDRLALELLKLGPVPVACLSPWVPAEQLLAAAQQPAMPAHYRQAYLARLADCHGLEPRLEVAAAIDTPVALLQKLVGELEPEVRALAQQNPSCPAALIKLVEEQWAIASSEDTHPEELTQLAQSYWPWIRQAVASNLASPEEALSPLAQDPVKAIQLSVAENPAVPEAVLQQLAAHPSAKIQAAVAKNPSLSEALQLEFLAKMPGRIRQRCDLKLVVLEKIYQLDISRSEKPVWKNRELLSILFRNPNTSTTLLSQLASHYQPKAVEAFYRKKNPRVNQPDQSNTLAKWVREAADYLAEILEHPNCSLELLEQIAEVDNDKVRLTLSSHPQAPVALLEQLGLKLLQADELRRPRDVHRELVAIAQNPRTPKAVLEQLVARYCEEKAPSFAFANAMLERQLSEDLKSAIRNFIQPQQSLVRLQNKLRQDPEARTQILQDWNTFRASLQDSDRQTLDSLCQMSMGAIGLSGGFPKADAVWAGARPESMMLFGFLQLFDTEPVGSSKRLTGEETVVVALAWHPGVSEEQQQKLRALIPDLSIKLADWRAHSRWRQALALNPLVPEGERTPQLAQIMALPKSHKSDDKRQLARSPHTPPQFLRQLISERNDYFNSYLARNPSLGSEDLVALLPKELNSVLCNPSFRASDAVDWLMNDPSPSEPELGGMSGNNHWSAVERQRVRVASRQRRDRHRVEAIINTWPDRHRKARQEQARAWSTTPETLDILAQDDDISIRQSVAGNGKLAAEGQRLLAQDSDMQVLLNLARRRSHHTALDSIAATTLFERGDRQVHLALARNETTPTKVIETLHQLNDPEITALLLTHPNTSAEILRQEIPLIKDEKRLGTVLRGQHNNSINRGVIPPEVLEPLVNHEKDVIRFLVARQISASPEILEKLSKDEHDLTRETVAANPSTPDAVLIAMAQHECQTSSTAGYYRSISYKILRRKDAPTEALDWIARNPNRRSNADVARHANTSTETLDWIAAHNNDDGSLIAVAQNSKTSADVLAKLAEQGSEAVREAVAAQPNCPNHILPLELLSQQPSLKVCLKIATNPSTPAEYLELFVTSQKPALRAAVAANPSLSPAHLATLAGDPKVEVRLAVSHNPNTPEALQAELKSIYLPGKVDLASPTLNALPQRYDPSSQTEADLSEILRSYAQSSHTFVRFAALLNPRTPVESLAQAAQSEHWLERYAVAENPALPQNMRQQLQGDDHAWVRAIAKGPH